MTDVKIDDSQVAMIISKQILDGLTTDQKDKMLTESIKQLVLPRPDSYGRISLSPLQQAFNAAVNNESTKLVEQWLKEPVNHEKIKGLINESLDKLLTVDRDKMVTSISEAFRKVLKG